MQTVPRDLLTDTAGDIAAASAALVSAFRGHISGLTMSTAGASNSFSVAAGVATSSNATTLISLPSAITKTTSAWAGGSGNGALDTGTIAASTWYHVHVIKNVDTPVVDVLISLSATVPTLPTGYTVSRRIGSLRCNASTQWDLFWQTGDEFLWDVPALNLNGAAIAATQLLSVGTPPGVRTTAKLWVDASVAGTFVGLLVASPDVPAQTVATGKINVGGAGPAGARFCNELAIRTDASAQVRLAVFAATTHTVTLYALGWTDRRGKD